MKLTLVIPCFNEAQSLPLLVERCAAVVTAEVDADILLVDNGSSDATPDVMARVLRGRPRIATIRLDRNRGYGGGILAGLRAAGGDVLAWTHADLQTNPLDALAALDLFRSAGDPRRLFVKGSRRGRPLVDRVFTGGMSTFETVLTGRLMRDINAQPTMFHRSFVETWSDPPVDFSLDLYAYWQAKMQRFAIGRIPVTFGPRMYGTSHWNTGMAARMKFVRRTLAYSLRLRRQIGRQPPAG